MKFKFFFVATAMIAALASCKKDDQVITNTVNVPVPAKQIESAAMNQYFFLGGPYTVTVTGSGNFEYGPKFAVSQPGKILRLACKMPVAGSYRVTLWDVASSAMIAQSTINQTANQTLTYGTITPVDVVTGKDYLVSIYSTGTWNEIRPTAGGSITYPINFGSIIIKGYQWIGAASPAPAVMPTTTSTSYLAGLADIEFQAN